MSRLRIAFFAVVGVLMSAAPALAQGAGAADNDFSVTKYKAVAAGFGFAIAAARARRTRTSGRTGRSVRTRKKGTRVGRGFAREARPRRTPVKAFAV